VIAAAGISAKEIEQVREAARAVTSLDRPVGENGSATFGDLAAGPEEPGPEDEVELGLRTERVRTLERRALELLAVNREVDAIRDAA
jgi:RNA polymerase primary sigma factor